MERMPRRWPHLTKEEVQQIFDASAPEKYGFGGMSFGDYMPPFCDELAGRTLTFTFASDAYGKGPARRLTYGFDGQHALRWDEMPTSGSDTCDDPLTHAEYYQCMKSEEGVYFFNHVIKGSRPGQFRLFVIDLNTGLVTMDDSRLGNDAEPREVARTWYFGRIEGYGDGTAPLHHFTGDLVGKAIKWTYHLDQPPIKHIYSTELFYSYYMQFGDRVWMASNPADYVKINDHLYIFSFLEERQTGCQGFFLINIEELHDVGAFTGINGNTEFECYSVGAKGEWSTMYTHMEEN